MTSKDKLANLVQNISGKVKVLANAVNANHVKSLNLQDPSSSNLKRTISSIDKNWLEIYQNSIHTLQASRKSILRKLRKLDESN